MLNVKLVSPVKGMKVSGFVGGEGEGWGGGVPWRCWV